MLLIFIVFLYAIGAHNPPLVDALANWSYFETLGMVDSPRSMNIIHSLPMHHYWDTGKASFRTGVLPDFVNDVHPDFVSRMDMRITRKGKTITVANATVVDQNVLFCHMIAAVQLLARNANNIFGEYEALTEGNRLILDRINQVYNVVTSDSWRSAVEVRLEGDLLRQRTTVVEQGLELAVRKYSKMREEVTHVAKEVSHSQTLVNERVRTLREQSAHNTSQIQLHKHSVLMQSAIASLEVEYQSELDALQSEHDAAVASFSNQVTRILQTASFRATEQALADFEIELIRTNLRTVSSDLSAARFERIGKALLAELSDQINELLGRPVVLLWWMFVLLMFLALIVVAREMGQVMVLLFMRPIHTDSWNTDMGSEVRPQSCLRISTDHIDRDSPTASQGTILTMESVTRRLILDLIKRLHASTIHISHEENGCCLLPMALLLGPGGCGKSETAHAIAAELMLLNVKVRCINVTGPQIAGKGGEDCGLRLRKLLRSAKEAGRRCKRQGGFLVLVLDGIEDMLLDRDIARGGEAKSGLPVLLNDLRENCQGLCVLVTAELTPLQVDTAFMDRVDVLFSLDRPARPLRRLHLLRTCQRLLMKSEKSKSTLLDSDMQRDLASTLSAMSEELCPSTKSATVATPAESAQSSSQTSGHSSLSAFVEELADMSEGWSYRALSQAIQALQVQALGSDSCVVTSEMLSRELVVLRSSGH
eukprot:gene4006-7981_t